MTCHIVTSGTSISPDGITEDEALQLLRDFTKQLNHKIQRQRPDINVHDKKKILSWIKQAW